MNAPSRHLPGDLSPNDELHRMIRVDQAGVYGAARIYAGQMAVLGKSPSAPVIRHMAEQEERHLATFNRLVADRGVRPTVLQPLWHVGGFALGAVTAALGEKAAMACTVAVETVIDEHYAAQEEALGEGYEPELKETIAQFRAEELEHRDTGLAHGAEEAPFYEGLSAGVRLLTRTAIWLSSRL